MDWCNILFSSLRGFMQGWIYTPNLMLHNTFFSFIFMFWKKFFRKNHEISYWILAPFLLEALKAGYLQGYVYINFHELSQYRWAMMPGFLFIVTWQQIVSFWNLIKKEVAYLVIICEFSLRNQEESERLRNT